MATYITFIIHFQLSCIYSVFLVVMVTFMGAPPLSCSFCIAVGKTDNNVIGVINYTHTSNSHIDQLTYFVQFNSIRF